MKKKDGFSSDGIHIAVEGSALEGNDILLGGWQ